MLVHAHWSFRCRMVLAIVVGLVCGLINGLLVTVVGLPSLAVTIGTLALFRGIAVGLLGTTAYRPSRDLDKPARRTSGSRPPVSRSSCRSSCSSRPLRRAAALHAVRPRNLRDRPEQGCRDFCGVPSAARSSCSSCSPASFPVSRGSSGPCSTARAGSNNALGLELQVIAAVLLGGVSIFGGRGAVPGVIAGVLLIGVLQSALLRLAGVTLRRHQCRHGRTACRLGDLTTILRRAASGAARPRRARQGPSSPRTGDTTPSVPRSANPLEKEELDEVASTIAPMLAVAGVALAQPRAHRRCDRNRPEAVRAPRGTPRSSSGAKNSKITFLPEDPR